MTAVRLRLDLGEGGASSGGNNGSGAVSATNSVIPITVNNHYQTSVIVQVAGNKKCYSDRVSCSLFRLHFEAYIVFGAIVSSRGFCILLG